MQQLMQMMMMGSQSQGSQLEENQGDDEPPSKKQNTKYKKSGDAKLDTASSYLFNLPQNRLQKMIETMHQPFDIIAAGELHKTHLLVLVWLMSGVKP